MRKLPYKRSNKKGSKYYIDFTEVASDGTSRKVTRSSRTTDYKLACQIQKKLQGEAAKRMHGVINPQEDGYIKGGALPVSETIDEFTDSLKASQVKELHKAQIIRVVKRFADVCGDKQVKLLSHKDCDTFVVSLMDSGLSMTTIYHHMGHLKRYGRWLDSSGKVPQSPFRHFRRTLKGNDPRRRRALLHDEVGELCKYLDQAPVKHGHTGAERKALYLFAIRTGLRINEIAQLRTKNFVFGTSSFVVLPKSATKNKKDAKLFLGESVGKTMQTLLSDGRTEPFRINLTVRMKAARMLREDMKAARKASERSLPFLDTRNVDFHALRHTCGAWLCWEGVPIQVVQQIMRHSSIKLTIDVYGHLLPDEIESTVAKTESAFAAYLLPN